MAQHQLEIVDGPNKSDLMSALFDHSNDSPRYVGFGLQSQLGVAPPAWLSKSPAIITTTITSMKREDGMGHVWSIEGFLLHSGPHKPVGFMASYDMRTCKGTLASFDTR